MKRGGTTVFKKRVKKTKRQAVWLNDEQLEILEPWRRIIAATRPTF
jgi:hypothetical protein